MITHKGLSKTKMRKKSMCWDKIYYRSVYDATEKIKELRKESAKYDHPYKIYPCPHCKGYHLSQRIDPIYRFLDVNEEIELGDTIVTIDKTTHREKIIRINSLYAFTKNKRYLRTYINNAHYKVEREVKQDIQVKKEIVC